ncbi:MAG: immunoglobulin domain-containing protein [Phycisphaerae bacterium]|nr:immunoglobulin domain-containing protein [Phycisphaerae bacterium]
MRKLMYTLFISLFLVCGVVKGDLAHRYSFDTDGNDSVGTAALTIGGAATVTDGVLDLPGGGTRVNNAHAEGAALTELAGIVNGSDTLSMEFWFNQDGNNNWAKLMMLGTDTNRYMDVTPRRGDGSDATSCSITDNNHGENNVRTDAVLGVDVDYYVAAIWNETTDSMTIVTIEVGNPANMVVATTGMGGQKLDEVAIDQFYLGSAVGWGDGDFDGQINEFRIYDHALNVSEAKANFLAGPDILCVEPVSPVRNAVEVAADVDLALQWTPAETAGVNKYYVFFGSDATAVETAMTGYATVVGATNHTISATQLVTDSEYFWKVGYELSTGAGLDPNTISGVWSFETKKTYPVISGPANIRVKPGQDADFGVNITTESNVSSVQWYKEGVVDALTGEKYVTEFDDTAATLTVLDIQLDDAGNYYCIVTNSAGPTTSAMAALGLNLNVAYYELETEVTVADPNVVDSSGYNNHGTASGDPTVQDGVIGNAFDFDGNDHVTIPRSIQDDFSIVLWVKTTQNISSTSSGWWTGAGLVNGEMPGEVDDFGVQLLGSKASCAVRGSQIVSATDINDGQWHLVVMTRERSSGQHKLYVDGRQEAQANATTASLTDGGNLTTLTVGKQRTGGGFFVGQLDDISLHDYVWSASDVAAAYYAVTGIGTCLNPIAADLNNDCKVNLDDFALLAGAWLDCNIYPDCIN